MGNGARGGQNKGKANISKGKLGREYVIHLVEALLKLAEENKDDPTPQEVKVEWHDDPNRLEVTGEIQDEKVKPCKSATTLKALRHLIEKNNDRLIDKTKNQLKRKAKHAGKPEPSETKIEKYIIEQVRNSIRYLQELELLEDQRPEKEKSNSPYWKFKLINLKGKDATIEENLHEVRIKLGLEAESSSYQSDSSTTKPESSTYLFQAPPLPTYYVERPEYVRELKERLLTNSSDPRNVGCYCNSWLGFYW